MFTHQYLQHKANILKRAETEIKTLLDDITSPEIREKVRNWKVGDPITDEQPHIGQKSDKAVQDKPVDAVSNADAHKNAPDDSLGKEGGIDKAQTPAPEQRPGPAAAAETNTGAAANAPASELMAAPAADVIPGLDAKPSETKGDAFTTFHIPDVGKSTFVYETHLEDHGVAKTEDTGASGAPFEEKKEAVETGTADVAGQPQGDSGAQLNHQPEGQPQQEPAGGNAPQ